MADSQGWVEISDRDDGDTVSSQIFHECPCCLVMVEASTDDTEVTCPECGEQFDVSSVEL